MPFIDSWRTFLAGRGASLGEDRVLNFGHPAAELAAVASGSVLVDLSHFSVIEAAGADTEPFLQGQVTSDVTVLALPRAQWSGYCTPKGRLLAVFLAWREGEGFRLLLPGELVEAVVKRLSMHVLRSKVKLADASTTSVRLGLAGARAAELLAAHWGTPPGEAMGVAHGEAGTWVALAADRFLLTVDPARAQALWATLTTAGAVPAGAAAWDWLSIRDGVPVVLAATQEEFVPQMANLDRIGGISFKKGCYTGQEIVARMHYLGRLKRRMYRVRIAADGVAPGDPLVSPDLDGQTCGLIALAAPSPAGGTEALAVLQIDSAAAGSARWKTLDGPPLEILPLPYGLA